jgi:hypothetical protein
MSKYYRPTVFEFPAQRPDSLVRTVWLEFIHKVNDLEAGCILDHVVEESGFDRRTPTPCRPNAADLVHQRPRLFGNPTTTGNYIESYPEATIIWQQRSDTNGNLAAIIVPTTQRAYDLFIQAEAELGLTAGEVNDGYGEVAA